MFVVERGIYTIQILQSGAGELDYRNLDKSLAVDQLRISLDKYKNNLISLYFLMIKFFFLLLYFVEF